jgi:hypothetical protein
MKIDIFIDHTKVRAHNFKIHSAGLRPQTVNFGFGGKHRSVANNPGIHPLPDCQVSNESPLQLGLQLSSDFSLLEGGTPIVNDIH